MTKSLFAAMLLATVSLSPAMAADAPAPSNLRQPAEKAELHYVSPDDFLPQRILAQPPVRGSETEKQELAYLHAEIAATPPERLERAAWDADHESPVLYNDVLARDLTKLPATWDLLITVQDEADAVAEIAKAAFNRPRPYGVDPTIPTCAKADPAKAVRSYPSGHASVGYSVGWALAKLLPELAPAILERARDYAKSRELCGMHFPSDTEASHVFATLVADRLMNDPRLASKIAAAKAELAASNATVEFEPAK